MADRTRIDSRRVPGFARAIAVVVLIPVWAPAAMLSRKRRGHLLVAGAVVALGLATSPATAGAVPSITVTPNTGLYAGQEVNVTGTGWEARLWQELEAGGAPGE
jgi:hypothetical protein